MKKVRKVPKWEKVSKATFGPNHYLIPPLLINKFYWPTLKPLFKYRLLHNVISGNCVETHIPIQKRVVRVNVFKQKLIVKNKKTVDIYLLRRLRRDKKSEYKELCLESCFNLFFPLLNLLHLRFKIRESPIQFSK
jgi:hypothetical protein